MRSRIKDSNSGLCISITTDWLPPGIVRAVASLAQGLHLQLVHFHGLEFWDQGVDDEQGDEVGGAGPDEEGAVGLVGVV